MGALLPSAINLPALFENDKVTLAGKQRRFLARMVSLHLQGFLELPAIFGELPTTSHPEYGMPGLRR